MNTLLIFFALPVATIILAIVVQKILRCAYLTAATFFAIYLIVTFAAFDTSFLVYAIIYTILAFITAYIAEFFFERCEQRQRNNCNCSNNSSDRINTISVNVRDTNNTSNNSNWCCYRR